MADGRVVGLALIGAGLVLHRVAVDGQRSAQVIRQGGARMAAQLRGVLDFAAEVDQDRDLTPAQRQALLNAYMRGQREGAELPTLHRG